MNPDRTVAQVAADPSLAPYRDRKRWWWLLSVVFPLLPFAGMAAHAGSGLPIALGLSFLYKKPYPPTGKTTDKSTSGMNSISTKTVKCIATA
jgi:hypothetical protein